MIQSMTSPSFKHEFFLYLVQLIYNSKLYYSPVLAVE